MTWQPIDCPACRPHNAAITALVLQHIEKGHGNKSHFFHGRFENIYLPRDDIPSLDLILNAAVGHAAAILGLTENELQIGFWFNLMQQGDVTSLHTHDDADELLSGTYYLQVPPLAGELVLYDNAIRHVITPKEGMFVFFSPTMPHEVRVHQDVLPRLSLGFNIG